MVSCEWSLANHPVLSSEWRYEGMAGLPVAAEENPDGQGRRILQNGASRVHRVLSPDELENGKQARWLELANHGFILLEAPDPRQNVDCVHLGSVRDRLDCPCPRRWVRSCEWHGFCTIDAIQPDDPHRSAFVQALERLGRDAVIACSQCADYEAEE